MPPNELSASSFLAADARTRSKCALEWAGDTLGKGRTSRPVSRDLIDEGWISGHWSVYWYQSGPIVSSKYSDLIQRILYRHGGSSERKPIRCAYFVLPSRRDMRSSILQNTSSKVRTLTPVIRSRNRSNDRHLASSTSSFSAFPMMMIEYG